MRCVTDAGVFGCPTDAAIVFYWPPDSGLFSCSSSPPLAGCPSGSACRVAPTLGIFSGHCE